MIHLDTTFLVDLLREEDRKHLGPANQLLDQLEENPLVVSVYAACELLAGAELARNPTRERARVQTILSSARIASPGTGFAALYAKLFAKLEQRGERIGVMDLLIATAALEDEAPLVTRNAREFSRLPDLRVISY